MHVGSISEKKKLLNRTFIDFIRAQTHSKFQLRNLVRAVWSLSSNWSLTSNKLLGLATAVLAPFYSRNTQTRTKASCTIKNRSLLRVEL